MMSLVLPSLLAMPPLPIDVVKHQPVEETLLTETEQVTMSYNITAASAGAFAEVQGSIQGYMPSSGGPFPLFMWAPGTGDNGTDANSQYIAQQMATRGFASE